MLSLILYLVLLRVSLVVYGWTWSRALHLVQVTCVKQSVGFGWMALAAFSTYFSN